MRVGNFSLLIPQGKERDSGHIELNHGQVYILRLGNHSGNRDTDAEVVIDGKPVGTFRIPSNQTVTLERPAHEDGRFTFYEASTPEASQAGVADLASTDRGLVQVRFRPGYARPPVIYPRAGHVRPAGSVGGMHAAGGWREDWIKAAPSDLYPQPQATYSADREEKTGGLDLHTLGRCTPGMTGLSGVSGQQFTEVPCLTYDPAEEVLISVRLVAAPSGPRVLTPVPAVKANPVPDSIG